MECHRMNGRTQKGINIYGNHLLYDRTPINSINFPQYCPMYSRTPLNEFLDRPNWRKTEELLKNQVSLLNSCKWKLDEYCWLFLLFQVPCWWNLLQGRVWGGVLLLSKTMEYRYVKRVDSNLIGMHHLCHLWPQREYQ